MASPPPPSSSPPSASHSQNSATPLMPPKVEDGGAKNAVPIDVMLDSVENMEEYSKYETDYTHRLIAKYFSKNPYGREIFEEKMRVGEETILSSRWSCTQSYADPVKGFEEQNNAGSTSEA
ncbi:hypothetical protein MANES_06G079602v8 [Manihot esculenta]|uniref:Uncharacterized protein n=1 Tax=Manihot esculenta TaxID=3983 RepID=A0ACB7HHS2_MANES|nr:hypothetical protein MANES_06G079602v8 [Manihot esculenta]